MGVIFPVPVIVPVSFQDFLGIDILVFSDFKFFAGILEIVVDSFAVTDKHLLEFICHFNSNMTDTPTIDCIVEVSLIEDVIVLKDDSLVTDSHLIQIFGKKICRITAATIEKVTITCIVVDDSVEFLNEMVFHKDVHNTIL